MKHNQFRKERVRNYPVFYFFRLESISRPLSCAYYRAKVDRMREDSEREKNEGERIRANLRDTIAQLAVMTKRSDEYSE